ncbi:MAG: methylenetetrahydrofolate reductase [Myxococcales bacterium]|nr:methylenetetrahydrofolate reductase [Myxococcales bacterium]
MKVTEHLERAKEPLISFEIIPPKRGGNIGNVLSLVDDLVKHRPPFIDITSHPAEVIYEETESGIQRHVKRKRPGTLGICALIQNKYQIDAVPHVLCHGFTQQETEDFLIELRYLGIDNVLAIRGDDKGYRKPLREGRTANTYAVDLVRQIVQMNHGRYLDSYLDASATEFCIGCSGYPEKHFEAPNLDADLRRTKEKVDAGAEYIVTQMFFDNRHYFDFVERCRAIGVHVPIIPGLKILTSPRQLVSIARTFHCEIPEAFSRELEGAKPEHAFDVGVSWAAAQTQELLDKGVPSVHFYVMSSASAVNAVLGKITR